MAPGTHIGAAHPVSGNGEKIDETMAKKMASDVAAYARTLATQRKRNVALVEQAVTESRSFTEQEALGATPPLIDLVANDVPDLVRKLDGRTIARFDGHSETLHTAGASTTFVGMTWSQRVLSGVAHPQVAYLLLTLGTLGLTIELWSPGAILPGVAGGICLLLAFFAFQVLPVSYAGVLLILFGLALLVLEVKVASFGLLAVGGIVALLFGSMMLIDSPLPEMQVGLRLIIPVTLGIACVLLFLVRLAVRSQRAQAVTGATGMIGEVGHALTAIDAGRTGSVRTHGEIWTATADEHIEAGGGVRVTGISGLVLRVVPSLAPEPTPPSRLRRETSVIAERRRRAPPFRQLALIAGQRSGRRHGAPALPASPNPESCMMPAEARRADFPCSDSRRHRRLLSSQLDQGPERVRAGGGVQTGEAPESARKGQVSSSCLHRSTGWCE